VILPQRYGIRKDRGGRIENYDELICGLEKKITLQSVKNAIF
jgi:hypothetical protein